MAPAVLVTLVMSSQIVFLLISQYTVLSEIQPGVGNWVQITGKIQTVEYKRSLIDVAGFHWSKLHVYRNIVKKGELEHEMTLFHAIAPIKKCFVPDTPFL